MRTTSLPQIAYLYKVIALVILISIFNFFIQEAYTSINSPVFQEIVSFYQNVDEKTLDFQHNPLKQYNVSITELNPAVCMVLTSKMKLPFYDEIEDVELKRKIALHVCSQYIYQGVQHVLDEIEENDIKKIFSVIDNKTKTYIISTCIKEFIKEHEADLLQGDFTELETCILNKLAPVLSKR